MTEAHGCEQLSQGCYAALSRWELNPLPIDRKSNALTLCDCATYMPYLTSRFKVKIATLCYWSHRLHQPAYLQLRPYDPPRRLRSSDADRLVEPVARTATAERRFSYFALRVWNALPSHVISADSLDSFKARLKTHLFDIV